MRTHQGHRIHTSKATNIHKTQPAMVRRQIQAQIRQTQGTARTRLRAIVLDTIRSTARRIQEERAGRVETSRAVSRPRRPRGQVHSARRSQAARRGRQDQSSRARRRQGGQTRRRNVLPSLRVYSGRVSAKTREYRRCARVLWPGPKVHLT